MFLLSIVSIFNIILVTFSLIDLLVLLSRCFSCCVFSWVFPYFSLGIFISLLSLSLFPFFTLTFSFSYSFTFPILLNLCHCFSPYAYTRFQFCFVFFGINSLSFPCYLLFLWCLCHVSVSRLMSLLHLWPRDLLCLTRRRCMKSFAANRTFESWY